MVEPSPGTTPTIKMAEDRLDSWKEIAAYLDRDVTTVQRWEKRERMPVHRHQHDRMGSVYAFPSELDLWQKKRIQGLEGERGTAVDVYRGSQLSGIRTRRRWLWFGVFMAAGIAAITYFVMQRQAQTAAIPKITSVAVLPLKNLSGDPGQEYLADGMTEALIGRLSGIRDLRVISRTSVMRFKDTQLSIPEIAKTLRVDSIVEGSVIRDGDRIRVHAQLIRAATDEHFWSEEYDRELKDVLALQSDVAQSIARKVEVTVTGKERERLSTRHQVSPDLYESYLKAWSAFEKSRTKADIQHTIADFEEATRKDPTFAPAWVGLAQAYSELGTVFLAIRDEPRTRVPAASEFGST